MWSSPNDTEDQALSNLANWKLSQSSSSSKSLKQYQESNYKNLPNTLWNEVIINIRYILDKHNYQAYGDDYDKYIEMTDSNTLHRLHNI